MFGQDCNAQKKNKKNNKVSDSTIVKKHSPKKATYLALVPGLGQIYNKKYWKLPIVYAGFAATGYFGITNRKEFLLYNEAYKCSLIETEDDDDIVCDNELAAKYTSDELKSLKDYYRRNMELSFIVMGAWYVLQLLDASVDAHLYYWEINEDLNVNIQPVTQPIIPSMAQPGQNLQYNGIKVSFNF
jgi:hypothetical protein